ncbi:hypothetical protein [Glutamicibacter ardleyensis]|uniref:hypothetical protein n=1 Tax=Glutamicibacter ardleyensis TaxID=225894 RepID=UPI003FD0F01F
MSQKPVPMSRTLSEDDLKTIDLMISGKLQPTSREHEWETNPESWKTPEDCPWGNLVEDFNEKYEDVSTMLDEILFHHPQMSEAFQDSMMNNLMFKEGTKSQLFPEKFTHEKFKKASNPDKAKSLIALDKITQEVVEFLNLEGRPLTTDGTAPDLRLWKMPVAQK